MSKRMLAALLALAGVFVALYLTLYKLGYIGTLACGTGSCETVQLSRWATFLAVPVGMWGVGYYVAVLVLSIVSIQPRFADSRGVSQVMVALTGVGLLFSGWLTYLELYVIHAICRWCVASAVIATLLFVISLLDLREVSALGENTAEDAAALLRGAGYGGAIRNTHEMSARAVTGNDKGDE